MRCVNCGWDNKNPNATNCEKCGHPIVNEGPQQDDAYNGVSVPNANKVETPAAPVAPAAPAQPAQQAPAPAAQQPPVGPRPTVTQAQMQARQPAPRPTVTQAQMQARQPAPRPTRLASDVAAQNPMRRTVMQSSMPQNEESAMPPKAPSAPVAPAAPIPPVAPVAQAPVVPPAPEKPKPQEAPKAPVKEEPKKQKDDTLKTVHPEIEANENMNTCDKCGSSVPINFLYCPKCGERIRQKTVMVRRKPKLAEPIPEKPVEEPIAKCSLTLIPEDEEETVMPFTKDYEGKQIVLNRNNTEPENYTITSKEQAHLIKEDGKWYIENHSELGTTYVQATRKLEIQSGDVIVLGDRRFKFTIKD